MVVLRSVQAENITSCNGVIHLPAGHHTLVVGNLDWSHGEDCGDCQIVGEPGTVLDAPVTCIGGKGGDGRRMRGHLTLNGSLVVQGHSQSQLYGKGVAVSGGLLIHGNISIKDCGIGTSYPEAVGWPLEEKPGWPLEIVGPQSGENMVSITNSSLSLVPFVTISNGARVTFSDFSYVDYRSNNLDIRNSSVIFERGSIWALHNHYLFQDSTIIASNTSFRSGDGHFIASNSVLNFTHSTVHLGNTLKHGYQGGSIDISNCSVDVTCGSDQGPVFSSTGGSMAINDSIVRFAQCSCHLDQAISLSRANAWLGQDHTLSFRKSSVTFSMCQANRASSKADPVVVVV